MAERLLTVPFDVHRAISTLPWRQTCDAGIPILLYARQLRQPRKTLAGFINPLSVAEQWKDELDSQEKCTDCD